MHRSSLLYLAKPSYGGWVTFTAHLNMGVPDSWIYKIGIKLEFRARDFGYGQFYQNLPVQAIKTLTNITITAIDKSYYYVLPYITEAKIVIHDPTELNEELLPHLKRLDVITIRPTVQKLLSDKYGIESELIKHPYVEFEYTPTKKKGAVSLCRVDFDKHTDIILDSGIDIDLYGAVNGRYVFVKLDRSKFKKLYKGKPPKNQQAIADLLSPKRFFVDMSLIKNDGGGTQYSFLEAINARCVLVIQRAWAQAGNVFSNGYNCITVDSPSDLKECLTRYTDEELDDIADRAYDIIIEHKRQEVYA